MSHTANLPDLSRRTWLTAATAAGGAGIVATSVPFVASMAPSERARALGAPVEVDLKTLRPGELLTVEWRGKPVWVLHRTPEMIEAARAHAERLSDPKSRRPQQPDYARNELRATKPEFGVMVAICTHLGCIPSFRPERGAADLGEDWPGGFFCPCHGSKFDLAGRVYKNVPAPSNLEVPPHHYLNASTLLIGVDPKT